MSAAERGPGKNANYGWGGSLEEPPRDPVVERWIAALFAKPLTLDEYEEQRRISAQRNAAKNRKSKELAR
jgi:hypothetical protein